MIRGIIAYQFDNPEDAELFETVQDVNCWQYERGYPADEMTMVPFSFGDDEKMLLVDLLMRIKSGEFEA